MRYYIADLHFFHEEVNQTMDMRGFGDVQAMNRYMMDKWNHKVREKDEVVILGDLSLAGAEETNGLLRQLHGRLFLIQGNHDKYLDSSGFDRGRFEWVRPYEELQDNRRKVILSHYPIMCYNGQYRLNEDGSPKVYMLYGHVHDSQDQRLLEQFQYMARHKQYRAALDGGLRNIPCNMINCFCMYSDYEPLTLDEWIENDRNRRKASDTFLR